jgi:2-hydroxychromene-2-carboxylate isomerase
MSASGYPMVMPGGALVSNTGSRLQTTQAMGGYSTRRAFTKRGTPRRIRRDGQPYAIPRMNPMNYRAARRAVTRIRGARKLLQRIERSLPRVQTRRRAA